MMCSHADIMDPLQEKHERWVGDLVIEQYNADHGTSFRFYGRAGEVPDLEYREGNRSLGIEVVTGYYDKEDAKFTWLGARKPDALTKLSGGDFDQKLVEHINSLLVAKCRKSYGPNCVLAVCVLPSLTRVWEMESRLEDIRIPATNPFDAIYLCGQFPAPIPNPAERRVWKHRNRVRTEIITLRIDARLRSPTTPKRRKDKLNRLSLAVQRNECHIRRCN